tara:strand:+ start:300 stop:515 length:216 start_codon:yes stop_codon:yes gene_type:complete
MKPGIVIRIEKNYGVEVIYPVCDAAKTFARIAKTKTLTMETVQLAKSLGFELIREESPNCLASKLGLGVKS